MKKIFIIVLFFFLISLDVKAITSIKIDNYQLIPYFSEDIFKYNVFVENGKENVNLTANLSDEDDYVTGIGNVSLLDGKTEVILKVIKKNSNILTYQVNIFKNYKEEQNFSNSTLNKLTIEGYELNFDPSVLQYTINVEDEERLNINYEQTADNSIVRITGNSNFKEGNNLIKIEVISKDKTNSTIYLINVNKLKSVYQEQSSQEKEDINILGRESLTKKETNIITIVIVTICLIIISFIFYLLFKYRKH